VTSPGTLVWINRGLGLRVVRLYQFRADSRTGQRTDNKRVFYMVRGPRDQRKAFATRGEAVGFAQRVEWLNRHEGWPRDMAWKRASREIGRPYSNPAGDSLTSTEKWLLAGAGIAGFVAIVAYASKSSASTSAPAPALGGGSSGGGATAQNNTNTLMAGAQSVLDEINSAAANCGMTADAFAQAKGYASAIQFANANGGDYSCPPGSPSLSPPGIPSPPTY